MNPPRTAISTNAGIHAEYTIELKEMNKLSLDLDRIFCSYPAIIKIDIEPTSRPVK
jgi:hypothetical protein